MCKPLVSIYFIFSVNFISNAMMVHAFRIRNKKSKPSFTANEPSKNLYVRMERSSFEFFKCGVCFMHNFQFEYDRNTKEICIHFYILRYEITCAPVFRQLMILC